jgi:hypothetical protein
MNNSNKTVYTIEICNDPNTINNAYNYNNICKITTENINPFMEFSNLFIEKSNNNNDGIKWVYLYNTFHNWYKNNKKNSIPTKKEIKDFLKNNILKYMYNTQDYKII